MTETRLEAIEQVWEAFFTNEVKLRVVSKATGTHFMFRVTGPQAQQAWNKPVAYFVYVWGKDQWLFLGTAWRAPRHVQYNHSTHSTIGLAEPAAVAITWFCKQLTAGTLLDKDKVEVVRVIEDAGRGGLPTDQAGSTSVRSTKPKRRNGRKRRLSGVVT